MLFRSATTGSHRLAATESVERKLVPSGVFLAEIAAAWLAMGKQRRRSLCNPAISSSVGYADPRGAPGYVIAECRNGPPLPASPDG